MERRRLVQLLVVTAVTGSGCVIGDTEEDGERRDEFDDETHHHDTAAPSLYVVIHDTAFVPDGADVLDASNETLTEVDGLEEAFSATAWARYPSEEEQGTTVSELTAYTIDDERTIREVRDALDGDSEYTDGEFNHRGWYVAYDGDVYLLKTTLVVE